MSDEFRRKLDALAGEQACVEIFRSPKLSIVGRLILASQHVFVVEKVSGLQADGLVAARVQDVTHMRWGSRDLELMSDVFSGHSVPAISSVALLDLSSAISVFNKMFGAVTVFAEDVEPETCFIGEEVSVTDEWVQLREFGARGK